MRERDWLLITPPAEAADVTRADQDRPPTSVLLPTVRWTDACDEVAGQLGGRDELLVICDTDDDPVAERRGRAPEGVRIVLAGEPEGCSGKANAIAAGMEAAGHDRIVWTDDDFAHPDDWLATLNADYERQGPTTEIPVFVGKDPLARLFEPAYAIGGTAAVFAGGIAWGGAVVFERDDLHRPGTVSDAAADDGRDADDPEAAFLADLRRTVSDDGTLTEYLDVTAADRTRTVPCGGSLRGSLERFVRFFRIVRFHDTPAAAFDVAFAVGFAALCLFAPVLGVALVTAVSAAVYARFGIRRATFLLAGPSVLLSPLFIAYALARRTFVWGGRRYRWRSLFDVEVLPA
ncbi:glycosyl transferase [Halorubrum kocurii JCM 14978]|uniref:Glycosyl transferase n=1 Tax=Halorubrum kocurii JCM 14978 TaxID=1230456 RepID=M0P9B2_9EURY|nr:glycosyl transferase [Halorubrum kocurii JCM 14978]